MAFSACALSGTFQDGAGGALVSALVRVRVLTPTVELGTSPVYSGILLGSEWRNVYTDSGGAFAVTVPQESRFEIRVPAIGVAGIGTSPAAATADLADLTLEWVEP